jgi:hypothetical protein
MCSQGMFGESGSIVESIVKIDRSILLREHLILCIVSGIMQLSPLLLVS